MRVKKVKSHSCSLLIPFIFLMLSTFSWHVQALRFGNLDARSLGMGGASVAAGGPEHAQLYNPALLSFMDVDENRSRNGRFIFPNIAGLLSEGANAAIDIVEDELEQDITDAVNGFNAAPDIPQTPVEVRDALIRFDDAINQLNKKDLELELFTSISVSEPANAEGGNVYFSGRSLVFGRADITDDDLALMDDYIAAMDQLIGGDDLADLDPNIVNNGSLVDPTDSLNSEASITSLNILEWGMAIGKQFPVFDYPIAFGITPKIMMLEVYREDIDFSDDIPTFDENNQRHYKLNLDFGMAAEFYDNFRAGLSVKNIFKNRVTSQNGLAVTLKPRPRLGFAYINQYVTVGLDADLQKTKLIESLNGNQELSLGVELRPYSFIDFRLGYLNDMAGGSDNVFSGGIRYRVGRFELEGSLLTGGEAEGGAFAAAYRF